MPQTFEPTPNGISHPTIPDCGDFEMRIAADGTWFHQGSPIGRIELVKLFSTILRREDDGKYWLVTPVERGEIIVEDAPYVAKEVWQDAGKIFFRTNIDKDFCLSKEHPLRVEIDPETQTPRPYIYLEKGLEARVLRSVFYHLVDMAELKTIDGIEALVVQSDGQEFELGSI